MFCYKALSISKNTLKTSILKYVKIQQAKNASIILTKFT